MADSGNVGGLVDIGSRGLPYHVPADCICIIAPYDYMDPDTQTRIWFIQNQVPTGCFSDRPYNQILWELRARGVRMVASQHTVPFAFAWDKFNEIFSPRRGELTVRCRWCSYTVPASIAADINVDLCSHPAIVV
ncbi:MAG: hypothetical protein BWY43_00351 [candidate division WS2 bacterium ADurb.Bin280]|uniref:Uncharacterized protein n=1 Tax=candidate division WS2 bacterium ADurb.Bin280 TaxID=1852829 RepID=A0A1V5SES8_9BACT|nr:MAG: hypothetical protein BWY43_00351 [candidate division WS2 bacterium ADurb.Bin280]